MIWPPKGPLNSFTFTSSVSSPCSGGAEGESWDKVVNGRSGGGAGRKGGGAWLALDCIRSSNHPQAETLLDRALERTPHDFRVYCIMGYLHIEQDNLARAADDFVQALYYADTKPQRIFIRFMLFRLCCLSGRMIDAEKHIDEIFVIDSRCLDAVFHSAVFSFRRGEEDRAMAKILGLVHDDRRYFIRALIAPELAPFHPAIARKLGRVYENARRIAEAGMQIAEIEMDRLKTVLGRNGPVFRRNDVPVEENPGTLRLGELFRSPGRRPHRGGRCFRGAARDPAAAGISLSASFGVERAQL